MDGPEFMGPDLANDERRNLSVAGTPKAPAASLVRELVL